MLQYSTGCQSLNFVCTWERLEYSRSVELSEKPDLRKSHTEYLQTGRGVLKDDRYEGLVVLLFFFGAVQLKKNIGKY